MSDNTPADEAAPMSSVSQASKEPKQTSAKSAGAKPATTPTAQVVVGPGATDPVLYSRARKPGRTENRNSLTVLHLQRRLHELGHRAAASDRAGFYGPNTEQAVREYQDSIKAQDGTKAPVTGILTRDEFAAVFKGDTYVTVEIDTASDHEV